MPVVAIELSNFKSYGGVQKIGESMIVFMMVG